MTEPSLTPLRSYGATPKRERPIYDEKIGGPLDARVRVVPITGSSIEPVRFEVVADWTGRGVPPLEPDPAGGVLCQDVYNIAGQHKERALAVARATAELMRDGQVPFLRHVATAVTLFAGAWRNWYADKIGGDWRAWAP